MLRLHEPTAAEPPLEIPYYIMADPAFEAAEKQDDQSDTVVATTTEESSEEEEVRKPPMGNYEKLSDFMGSTPTMSIFRRFTSESVLPKSS